MKGKKQITAVEIIEKRKELWQKHKNIEKDREFIEAVADSLVSERGEKIRKEIQEKPELLIELCFVIVDKNKNTVPFFLNEVQRDFVNRLNKAKEEYEQGKRVSIKFLVLKGRQQGFTSFITAYQLACTITRKNFEGFTAADEDTNTAAIFENKAKFPYANLPEKIKPTEKYNNRKQLLFEKLHSSWEVKTASKNMGRSRTINFFHGSEVAFWKDGISGVQAGLGEALTKDAIQIFESTANGYNEYKDLWDSGQWENCFYEWWLTKEYQIDFESKNKENWFKEKVKTSSDWIFQRCKWLLEEKGLSWGQIYWYYNKYKGYINKDLIKQEYPCTPDEAFLASGACIFDKEIIIRRKEYLKREYEKNPPKKGFFLFEWNNPEAKDFIKDNTIRFIEDKNGYITIYEDAQKGYPYVIGGDTKGEGSDFFAATVVNNVTGKRCATLHADMDPDTYAHQMYCLGKYYNYALIGIEINFDLYPVKELERLNYHRQYIRQHYDSMTNTYQKKNGWKTDGNTRPLIISREITLIRDNIDLFNHIEFLNECLTFIKDEKGRPDAEAGKHDDILFSDMIAEAIREQQTREIEPEQIEIPDDLPEDVKEDLMNDPRALELFLKQQRGEIL